MLEAGPAVRRGSRPVCSCAAEAAAIVTLDTIDVPTAVPATLASAVLWFALGYAFWSVAFAAIGAMVSRVEDLSAAILPLTWILTVSAFAAPVASDLPDAWYMRLASIFPTTAPFVMPVRVAVSDVPAGELVLAVAIMLAATYGLVRLGSAVYSGALLRATAPPRRLERRPRGLDGKRSTPDRTPPLRPGLSCDDARIRTGSSASAANPALLPWTSWGCLDPIASFAGDQSC